MTGTVRTEIVERDVVHDLQWRVLREGWPPGSFPPDPPGAFSVAALTADGEVIGAATFIPRSSPVVDLPGQWQLRYMATAASHRGQGVGAAVVSRGVAEIAQRGGQSVWCNARTVALPFYRRAGFVTIGEEFIVAEVNLPHYVAARPIHDSAVAAHATEPPA